MSIRLNTLRFGVLGAAGAALAVAAPLAAQAQHGAPAVGSMSHSQMAGADFGYSHGGSYQPVHGAVPTSTAAANGVETVVYTNHAAHTAHTAHTAPTHTGAVHSSHTQHGYVPQGYYPGAAHSAAFSREHWLAECERRTYGTRDRKKKGGIIGSLLGAITGGIIGNRVADSERLGGTLIGAGVGGLAGLAIGGLIDRIGRNDRGDYDCEAALDGYLAHYGAPHGPIGGVPAPTHGYGYTQGYGYAGNNGYASSTHGYAGGYYPGCACQPQVTYIPIHYYQRQRVVVRETVTEEIIPGKKRHIPGKYVKTETHVVQAPAHQPQPQPKPVKTYHPQYVKTIKY